MRKEVPLSREPFTRGPYDAIAATVGSDSPERDRDGHFPISAFNGLRDIGLVAHPPLTAIEGASLFRLLASIGRGDLSVGRIFEGHVNALFLIEKFGTAAQCKRYRDLATSGRILGVWNTDMPHEPVRLQNMRLRGKKNFASGVDGLSHAVITASIAEGRLMIVVPVAGLPIDRSWWRPLGMRASGSHVVDFTGMGIESDWILGGCNDYDREPWFSAGAIRFAAVHVGGMHAVFDAAVKHLRATQRTADPYQLHRLGQMGLAVESGYAWLERAAKYWAEPECSLGDGIVTIANAARLAIEGLALTVLEEAERSVGAAGLIAPHPLERLIRDLRTYLRQPNPDGALASLGSSIAEGKWRPGSLFN
jgi:alkylation response protein AidB-like acyl-CoA dehydrogenase